MEIKEVSKRIHENAKNKGFWDDMWNITKKMKDCGIFTEAEITSTTKAFKSQKLMLIVSELSEGLEADRKNKYANVEQFKKESDGCESLTLIKESFEHNIKDSVEDEMADTTIRILDYIEESKIDLEFHIEHKMNYNATRARLHGKAY